MPNLFFRGVFCFGVGLLSAAPLQADLVIDGFSSPAGGQVASDDTINGVPVISSLGGQAGLLGMSREIIVNKTGQIGFGTQTVRASSNEVDTDIFNFDQFSSTARGTANLIYDGGADGMLSPMGLGGVDLTQGGTNAGFVFENLTVTGSGLMLTVNLYNAATGALFTSGAQLLTNGFMGDYVLLYSSFVGPGGALTPTNVGAIEIIVDGSAIVASGSDLTFALVSSAAVPEPSSMVLCGLLSLAGVGYRLRRRPVASAAA
ncbi:MAG: PEP-CTERM sorting domain-containing protein [Planctomycetota bacterium]|nr:PEP-CTERM sorting domain-containing protein [Planctomycetota bacterium]